MQSQLELSLSLPPIPEAAAEARRTLRDVLADQVDPTTVGDAELLVSELITNAVRHAALKPGDDIKVRIRAEDDSICVEVTDPGDGFAPEVIAPNEDRTGGFGLFLLDRMSRAWGIARPPTRIWFELVAPDRRSDEAN